MADNQFPTPTENGKPVVFEDVFNKLYSPLRNYAWLLTSSKEEAKDIVAESFVKLWKQMDKFDTMDNIRAFLYITVRNCSFDYLRKKKTESRYYQHLLRQQDAAEIIIGRPEIETEFMNRLYQEVEKLPEQCKEIFKLTYLKGLSNQEAAEVLGKSVITITNQKSIALKTLRIAFKDKDLIVLLIILTSKFFKN